MLATTRVARYGMPRIPIAMNLSPMHFVRPEVIAEIHEAMTRHGIEGRDIELEVTESVFLHDSADSAAIMGDLREMGIKVVIDDFGVGFSSLSYLQRMPVSALKIDHSFIRDVQSNSRNGAIVRAIVAMAKSLGIGVIAEGVATIEEKDFLIGVGCHEMQGSCFARPLLDKDFVHAYLAGENSLRLTTDA